MATVCAMPWVESERGWGRRAAGCSIHVSKDAALEYMAGIYLAREKETYTPPIYYYAETDLLQEWSVSPELFQWVQTRETPYHTRHTNSPHYSERDLKEAQADVEAAYQRYAALIAR
jgi:hypothetical protein